MAQHDYDIANQTAVSARTDINNVLSAIKTLNSGATAPASTNAFLLWYDTGLNILKIRNAGNTAWISVGTFNQTTSTFEPNQSLATQTEAQTGTENTKLMTALRVKQSITANVVIPLGLGEGQQYYNGGRAVNTWYQNTTGKPIMVFSRSGVATGNQPRVGPSTATYVSWAAADGDSGTYDMCTFIVPNLYYYYVLGGTLQTWVEMR